MTDRRAGQPGAHDLNGLGLSGMVQLTSELRRAAEVADGFAEAAGNVVRQLRAAFAAADGEPALRLVRLFSTRRRQDLDEDQLAAAAGVAEPAADLRFLTLEASAGAEEDWNDPKQSRLHRVVPLVSVESLAAMPMTSALLDELGLPLAEVVSGSLSASHGRYGVFHVADALGNERIPDQEFVRTHRIASVLGFGGALPDGNIFCVLMFSKDPIPVETARLFRAVAVGVRAGLLVHRHGDDVDAGLEAERKALREHLEVLEETSRTQAVELEDTLRTMRAEAELVDTLQVVGRRLTAQLDLDAVVQDATDAATKATRAAFGAFFYNLIDEYGESYTLYTSSGVPKETFAEFPMPRNTAVFEPTFTGTGTVRSDDITRDPRYGHNEPHRGMPKGHLPVCSYLAVPVISPTSQEVLGGFFFGHPEPGRFTARHEQLAEGIAGYAAIAVDNARLFASHRMLATELTRSLLPTVPRVVDLDIASSYRPAASGSEVGGDWFEVIELPAGRTGFVIGDVVGRGVTAAAVMGQIRTAVRSYALLDLPPADVLRNASRLADNTPGASFITCFYAVHDPVDHTLVFANAGHLPAVLHSPGQDVRLIGEGIGLPLGVGETFRQSSTDFPPGARLTLYTDGLVERRKDGFTTGMEDLLESLDALAGAEDLQAACDGLIDQLTGGRHDDDVAFLHVRHTGGERQVAVMPLSVALSVAADARAFVAEHLKAWDLAELVDVAMTVTTELVGNAVRHTSGPGDLRLHHDGSRLTIEVADRDPAVPQLYQAALNEERHRGLFLVNAFATRWGIRATADGKIVWAEIATRPVEAMVAPTG